MNGIAKKSPVATAPGRTVRLAAALIGLLTLAACASAPVAPTQSLQAAKDAITTAEQARVADYASLELSQARDKRLADESLLDAQLATARAGELKAKKVNEDMKEGTKVLKQEMDRNTGNQQ